MRQIKKLFTQSGVSIVFMCLLFICSIGGILLPDETISQSENRPLQMVPKISKESLLDSSYQKEVSSYISDQFPLRSVWVQMHSNLQYAAGVKELNGVYIGKEHELFQENVKPSKGMLNEKLSSINNFAKHYPKIKMSMLLVPNKATVLEDKLPSFIPNQNQIKSIQNVQRGLNDNIKFVNVTAALQKQKDEYIYYRSDHHWTNLGAYYAFEAWKNAVLPDETLLTYDTYDVHYNFFGTMSKTSGYYKGKGDTIKIVTSKDDPSYLVQYAQDKVTNTSLFDEKKVTSNNPYDVFLSGNQPLIDISTTVENEKHLLLLKDSYANCFVSYLLPYYSKITIVDPRYYYEDLHQLIKDRNITDTLFLYNANTFFSDASLQSALITNDEIR